MCILLTVTVVVAFSIPSMHIFWRQEKLQESEYAVNVMRTDGKVVLWDGGDGR